MKRLLLLILLLPVLLPAQTVRIGSKQFPESRLLAEIMAQLIEQSTDLNVERKFGLGGTLICFEAMQQNELDIYPEYTGTGLRAILNDTSSARSTEETFFYVQEQFLKALSVAVVTFFRL